MPYIWISGEKRKESEVTNRSICAIMSNRVSQKGLSGNEGERYDQQKRCYAGEFPEEREVYRKRSGHEIQNGKNRRGGGDGSHSNCVAGALQL